VRQDADFLTAFRKLPSVYDWHAQAGPQPEPNICSICSASMKLTSRSVPEFLPPPTINFLTEKPSPSVRRVLSILCFIAGSACAANSPPFEIAISRFCPSTIQWRAARTVSELTVTLTGANCQMLTQYFFPLWSPFNRPSMKSATAPGQNPATTHKTFNDYLEFFLHVASNGSSEPRAEFVRQVMSLK
jgi:hypothetical protein